MNEPSDRVSVAALARLTDSGDAADALLRNVGVTVHEDGFSAAELADLLRSRLCAAADVASAMTYGARDEADSPALQVARHALEPYGIDVVDVFAGRRVTVLLRARDEDRFVHSYDLPGDVSSVRVPAATDRSARGVAAQLYSTVQRRSGSPLFLASGYEKPGSPDLYLFVLTNEKRLWILTRDDLIALRKETKLAKRKTPRPSFVEHTGRPGTLRIWMPMGHRTGADPSERIAGADGLLLRS